MPSGEEEKPAATGCGLKVGSRHVNEHPPKPSLTVGRA